MRTKRAVALRVTDDKDDLDGVGGDRMDQKNLQRIHHHLMAARQVDSECLELPTKAGCQYH